MTMHSFLFVLFLSLFAVAAPTNSVTAQSTIEVSETAGELKLPPGKSVRDSKGRVVENGANNQGKLKIKYSGKLTKKANGDYEVSEEITGTENPTSDGSNSFSVNTNGHATTIVNNESDASVTVTGGNATLTIGPSANNNTISVGGTGNTVSVQGTNNTGSGAGATSGGVVTMTGGNSWASGGGTWTVRT